MNKKDPSKKGSQPPKRIIVLGVMRSGTSLTADLITFVGGLCWQSGSIYGLQMQVTRAGTVTWNISLCKI